LYKIIHSAVMWFRCSKDQNKYWTYPLYVYVWKAPNNILDWRFQCLVR